MITSRSPTASRTLKRSQQGGSEREERRSTDQIWPTRNSRCSLGDRLSTDPVPDASLGDDQAILLLALCIDLFAKALDIDVDDVRAHREAIAPDVLRDH